MFTRTFTPHTTATFINQSTIPISYGINKTFTSSAPHIVLASIMNASKRASLETKEFCSVLRMGVRLKDRRVWLPGIVLQVFHFCFWAGHSRSTDCFFDWETYPNDANNSSASWVKVLHIRIMIPLLSLALIFFLGCLRIIHPHFCLVCANLVYVYAL